MEEYVENRLLGRRESSTGTKRIVYWEEEKEGYLRGKRGIRAKNVLLCADILLFSS